MESFGQRITHHRRLLGLSQADLGRSLGTSSSVIGRYERSEMQPTIAVAAKLAAELGTTLSYLVGESDHARLFEDSSMLRRLDALDEMGEEDRERVIHVVDALIRDAVARKAYTQ